MKQEIKLDKRNYRKHSDKNKDLINKSLKELGAGRSIVIDSENEIIAGNGVYEQAKKLGLKEKIIETDGTELIVVKRNDLKTSDEKRKKLAVSDNSTSDLSDFDMELLGEDFKIEEIEEWGIEYRTKEFKEEEIIFDNSDLETKEVLYNFSKQYYDLIHKEIKSKLKEDELNDETINLLIYCNNYITYCKRRGKRFSVVIPLKTNFIKEFGIDYGQIVADISRYLYDKYRK